MAKIVFNQRVKHGRLDFHPGVVYGFDDPGAAPYFKACGWAGDADEAAEVQVQIALDEIDIDPETVFGSGEKRGQKVMEA